MRVSPAALNTAQIYVPSSFVVCLHQDTFCTYNLKYRELRLPLRDCSDLLVLNISLWETGLIDVPHGTYHYPDTEASNSLRNSALRPWPCQRFLPFWPSESLTKQMTPVITLSLLRWYTRHAYIPCTTKAMTALIIGESKFAKKNSPSLFISPNPNTNQWKPSATVNIVWTNSTTKMKWTATGRCKPRSKR